jgi:hypothetical protein
LMGKIIAYCRDSVKGGNMGNFLLAQSYFYCLVGVC